MRAIADATGAIASGSVTAYDAFGVQTDTNGSVLTPIQYAGQWIDGHTGLSHNRDRWLDLATGRFTQSDRYEGRLEEPLTLHKRIYAHGNPMSGTDPDGFMTLSMGFGLSLNVDVLVSVGARVLAFGPYAAGVAALGLGATATVQALGGAAAVQGAINDWISSGEAALTSAAVQMIGRTLEVANAMNDAISKAISAGRATLSQLMKYPFFPVFRSATPDVYKLNVSALAANPAWYVLNYLGPNKVLHDANRRVVWGFHGWKMQTAPPFYQLHEFPYASTTQGGRPAMATPVPAAQNLSEGALLGLFYRYSLKQIPRAPFLVVPVPI